MKTGLRYFICFSCIGLSVISGLWIIAVGWVLFEWALAFKDLTSRKANDIFDEVVKLAVSLDLKISFSSSTQCVAGFDLTTDDGRNINLSVKVYKDVELQVGYFTYCKYVTQTKFDVKSKHVTLANLEPTFQSILRELADDHYVELNRA
jgi:hypothetical protein